MSHQQHQQPGKGASVPPSNSTAPSPSPPPPTSSSSSSSTPPITAEQAVSEFRAGVTATLRSWSALRAAVESQWGGPDSYRKAEELRAHIYTAYDGTLPPSKVMPIDELEDNLSEYMEEEFSVILEDCSEREVAQVIWQMYDECSRGNVEFARRTVRTANDIMNVVPSSKVAVRVEGEMDEDDDGDDEEGDEKIGSTVNMMTSVSDGAGSVPSVSIGITAEEYASSALFGVDQRKSVVSSKPPPRQLGEPEPEKPKEEVDEDGFITVSSKRGKRR